MRCSICHQYGIYWKDLHTLCPYTYCPNCQHKNCHEIQNDENEEEIE